MTFVKAAVIGHPVGHSKSPLIHNEWIRQHHLDGSYNAVDIAPDDFEAGIRKLVQDGYTGWNVTVPHKESMMALCDTVDDTARSIGAVNTVTVREKKLHGTNTDAFGFLENIKQARPGFSFTSGPAIILGAGGAARAVLYGLLQEGVPDIRLTNRTREKAEELKAMAPDHITVIDWDKRNEALESANLLVNTTVLGMEGKPPLEINLDALPEQALVNDIVYVPLYTDLLTRAKQRGNPVVTGIGMLLHQARPAFEHWFDIFPDVTAELEKKVLA